MRLRPDIEPIRDAGLGLFGQAPLFRLEAPWKFELAIGLEQFHRLPLTMGLRFTIPAGYEFDKASIPRVFWGPPLNYLPDGLCTVPALEHDFLCDLLTGGSEWLRKQYAEGKLPVAPPAWAVHEHFRRRLHEAGVRSTKAEAMGRAVAWFGPGGRLRPGTWWKALVG